MRPNDRIAALAKCRNLKMARSSHGYVRGNTVKYYEWLASLKSGTLPDGPPVWICGDCHICNLGPVANSAEHGEIQIRDLDQTVIGNPAHDLIRLGLSLASAARGSNLPGITTAKMLEKIMEGYEAAFEHEFQENDNQAQPEPVKKIARKAAHASRLSPDNELATLRQAFPSESDSGRSRTKKSATSPRFSGLKRCGRSPPDCDRATTMRTSGSSMLPIG